VRRFYLKVYLAFLGIVLAFFALSAALVWGSPGGPRGEELLHVGARVIELALPGADAEKTQLEAVLEGLAGALGGGAALYDSDGGRLAGSGGRLVAPRPDRQESHWIRSGRGRFSPALRLSDGRWLVLRLPRPERGGGRFLLHLAILTGAIALGALPLARGITRPIEQLTARVRELGEGQLATRVEVSGSDEIARLGHSFNQAAERIEMLVNTQRTLLASASHELRSPLARLRVAAELLGRPEGLPQARAEELRGLMARDIGVLDAGVEELLVVSRLDMLDVAAEGTVDLLALAAEEAAVVGAEVTGELVTLRGDARSLRHLLRNLLENARHHAGAAGVEVEVAPLPGEAGAARLRVSDRGPGIAAEDRERIFEPFRRGSRAADPGTGVGLGLAIVRQIARHHRGTARVLARDGGGSIFEVVLRSASQ
jgi:signal transduction histidine kinase